MSDDGGIERLMVKAHKALAELRTEETLEIGRQLEELRFTGGFEVQALAHRAEGDLDQAIAVLERATGKAPGVWMLWYLLANSQADKGRLEDAIKSYEKAVEMPGADVPAVVLNMAIAADHAGRTEDARQLLVNLRFHPSWPDAPPEEKVRYHRVFLEFLETLAQPDDAISLHQSLKPRVAPQEHATEWADVMALYARALWLKGRTDDARAALQEAIALDRTCERAQRLTREMRVNPSAAPAPTNYYEVVVRGSATPSGRAIYKVAADSVDEALEMIREFEPADARAAAAIDEVITMRPRAIDKGVHWISAAQGKLS